MAEKEKCEVEGDAQKDEARPEEGGGGRGARAEVFTSVSVQNSGNQRRCGTAARAEPCRAEPSRAEPLTWDFYSQRQFHRAGKTEREKGGEESGDSREEQLAGKEGERCAKLVEPRFPVLHFQAGVYCSAATPND